MSKIQSLHPAAKIVLHHTCKNGSGLRGSGDLSAVVDSHLQLKKTENCKSIFTHAKSRWGKAVDDFAVDWIEEANSLAFAYTGTPDGEETCDESEKIIQAIQNADGILSRAEIIKISGVSERTVDRMLKSLVEKGILLAKKSGRFMDYFLTDDKGNTEE